MTKQELKEFLFHSMKLWGDHLPNYHINLHFESENLDASGLEVFVDKLQSLLQDKSIGELVMFGIDDDYKSGDFKIFCTDTTQIQLASDHLKTFVKELNVFDVAYFTLLLPTESGGYKKEGTAIGELDDFRRESEEMNVHLPVPPGVTDNSKWGCLPQNIPMAILITWLLLTQ